MAARTRKGTTQSGWPVEVRERIKTSMLINRLTDHALGKVHLEATQVRAIEILLRKSLPDLQATELSGSLGVKTHEDWVKEQLAGIVEAVNEFEQRENEAEPMSASEEPSPVRH